MSSSTVVFITGVSRGIGHAVCSAYLSRPNHTVVGSVRDANAPKAQELNKLPTAEGSRLLLVSIENKSTTDAKKAAEVIEASGIDHIDIVISNAGVSHTPAPLDIIDPELLVESFRINALSSILLFQAVKNLLLNSSQPKWVSVSTRIGSIGQAAEFYYYLGAYGTSKAAQNWFTQTIHQSIESLTAFAVHPGFVSTDMGNNAAKEAGLDPPATTPEESATNLLQVIESATRDTTSGKFIDIITGEEFLW